MKLIVGLGNPGIDYQNTRHNTGFLVLDSFFNSNLCIQYNNNYESFISTNGIGDKKYILCKPQAYMNNSGIAVKKIRDFFKLEPKDILVIYDEANINIGKYKLSVTTGHGGHNGVKNIISELNTNNFLKLKVGIKNKNKDKEIIGNFVLQRFNEKELIKIKEVSKDIEAVIKNFVCGNSFKELMNKHN